MAKKEPEAQGAQQEARTVEVSEGQGLLDKIVQAGRWKGDVGRTAARDIIAEFAKQVIEGEITISKDTEAMINARIAQIDSLISRQLNEIMHAEPFQKLEASWRGLHYLVDKTETGTQLKIRVFNVAKRELSKDLERAIEFDQSQLFKKIYSAEYDMFGGEPFGALVGDFEFGKDPRDVSMLEKISNVAAAAHAPFISAASADLLNLESYTQLDEPRDLAKIFETSEYVKWRSFRDSEDSRYVAMCMPHVLMRAPYEEADVEAFRFKEEVDGKEHKKYLWGNAAYALAARLTDSFAKYGWCTAIRGVEGGGIVMDLPTHTFKTDEGDIALKCPTEIAITERRDKELADLGFVPLVHCKGKDYAAFFSGQSAQKPKKYREDAANASAQLSARLPYLMAVSRFAHYMKAMMRDKIGSFTSRGEAQNLLERWIAQYVLLDDTAGQEIKAQKPLREARIEVKEIPGRPGCYRAVAHLRPHFQLEEIDVSLRLVADLPPPAQG